MNFWGYEVIIEAILRLWIFHNPLTSVPEIDLSNFLALP